jgi:transposase
MIEFMSKSPEKPHGNTKFTEDKRKEYLDYLRRGNLKFEAARMVGVSYRTVERRRADDEVFRLDESRALAESREGVEKVLRDMALQGDLGAIKLWLTAHDRSTYGEKRQLEIDATPDALALGQAEALARVAELQTELARRAARLDADDVIDVSVRELGGSDV